MHTKQYARTIAQWPYGKGPKDCDVTAARHAFERFIASKLAEYQKVSQRDILLRLRVIFEAESALDDMGNHPDPGYLRGITYAIAVVDGLRENPEPP